MTRARWFLAGIVMAVSAASAQGDDAGVARATEVLAEALTADAEGVRLQAAILAAELSNPGLQSAARTLAASPDRYERSLALELLAHIDVEGNRDLFEAALTSPFRSVRVRAVGALATLKDPGVEGQLASVLAGDSDPDIRALAAEALGGTGGEHAATALRRALDDPHPVVQAAVVEALAAAGDHEVGFELLGRVGSAAPPEARRLLGLTALVPNRELIPLIGELLASPEQSVRVAAAAAILRIDGRAR